MMLGREGSSLTKRQNDHFARARQDWAFKSDRSKCRYCCRLLSADRSSGKIRVLSLVTQARFNRPAQFCLRTLGPQRVQ
jgi:hypothetical protein